MSEGDGFTDDATTVASLPSVPEGVCHFLRFFSRKTGVLLHRPLDSVVSCGRRGSARDSGGRVRKTFRPRQFREVLGERLDLAARQLRRLSVMRVLIGTGRLCWFRVHPVVSRWVGRTDYTRVDGCSEIRDRALTWTLGNPAT